ncbi:RNA-directed DNA polymerase from mobile element jockey [Plakobranchus ocellatus]|uniref:RNA-directed DNA polymerase from mobile element jockey n=1 Tax=Plakobranchus ocellatus TaxID=259542 RepID=A0AAV4DR61_9GAST|nr:RNA-directed DNA polymerase from mobile element jockey [Plakobranchus ocellatus]
MRILYPQSGGFPPHPAPQRPPPPLWNALPPPPNPAPGGKTPRSSALLPRLPIPSPPKSMLDPRGEAAHLIRNEIRFSEIDLKTGLHAAAATISLEKALTVCSLYLPPNSRVSKLSLAELFEQLPKPFLVLNLNAHSSAWGDSRRDGRGRMLEEFTAENDHSKFWRANFCSFDLSD